MRRLTATAFISLALFPASASASSYTEVLRVYQARGFVPACQFSSPQLSAALRGVDAYGQQYFADFSNAVQSALAQRAAGACLPGAHHPAGQARLAQRPLPPSPTSATNAAVPLPILLLGAITVALALATGFGALVRSVGWDPTWAAAWRHAWAEAAYRAAGGWAELVDWWRLGR